MAVLVCARLYQPVPWSHGVVLPLWCVAGTINPAAIMAVAVAMMVAHIPGLELASLWNRFDPNDQTTDADYRRFLATRPPPPSSMRSNRQLVSDASDDGGDDVVASDASTGGSPGIFFYQLVTCVVFYCYPARAAVVLGPMYFGDPAAAIVGRLLGGTSGYFQASPGDARALRHAPRRALPATKTVEG